MTKHQASGLSSEEIEERVRKVEVLISNLLRAGVVLSLALVVLGTVVAFVQHPEYLAERSSFGRFPDARNLVPHSLGEVGAGLKAYSGESIVTLGILLLIATPVIRVGVSIFAFVYQRDWLYSLVTATVFCLLLISFFLGKVE
ncbi:MAG TPA: DUF1634 domain-containing protein [Candidatus Binatia bacterium]|jgi:uncharacterized membrane protein